MSSTVTVPNTSTYTFQHERNAYQKTRPLELSAVSAHHLAVSNIWYRSYAQMDVFTTPKLTFRPKLNDRTDKPASSKSYVGFTTTHKSSGRQTKGSLTLTAELVNYVLSVHKVARSSLLRTHTILLVLEHHFSHALDKLEQALSCDITLDSYSVQTEVNALSDTSFGIEITSAGTPHSLDLEAPFSLIEQLCTLMRRLPLVQNKHIEIPILGRVVIGEVVTALGTLKKVNKDDVLLTNKLVSNFQISMILGEKLTCRTRIQDGKAIILDKLSRLKSKTEEDLLVQDAGKQESAPGVHDADLDELLVKLVFEVGRREFNLGEIQRLSPGFIFDLAREKRTAVDIFAGTRRIGSGELVQINENVGVRVTRLFNNE